MTTGVAATERGRMAGAATPAAVAGAGAAYAVHSLGYGLGSITAPDAGFVPFLAGCLLAGSGAVVAVGAYRRARPVPVAPADEPAAVAAPRLRPVPTLAAVVGLLAIVLWQTNVVGLLPATAVLVGAAAYLMRIRIPGAVCTGVAFYFAAFLVFEYWLGIPLPHGYLP
ncbi:tripartite tricarboxylate transporter TctB family protein [Pseudonocardia nigra]|uniref:tripartite tricarboxylate transporter TctB family protein n=1 Tax=Pseudonocardia nigra TaxID=1921578 RepID=UPI001C5EC3DF|nr:tripartite tricarboxylate transporter TctB family protein [Pseudonocardia nigra]